MSNLSSLLSQLIAGDDHQAEAAVHEIAELGDAALPDLCALVISDDANDDADVNFLISNTVNFRVEKIRLNLLYITIRLK